MRYTSILFFFFICFSINGQSKKVKIIDSLSLESIPFASVYFSNNNGLISDEEGYFELIPEQFNAGDTLFVSSLGFKKKRIPLNFLTDSIIRLR
ncbi:MAG: carboxypeptidase-like regulatory domain-containing protein, partial [Flavobacteriaceae bacterium]|nr:carboxypeptidase-like regulatory domain-containing protein [Flavobacteriaceae bacterium]